MRLLAAFLAFHATLAEAALYAEVGQFSTGAGTGNLAVTTTGTPKALIVWAVALSGAGLDSSGVAEGSIALTAFADRSAQFNQDVADTAAHFISGLFIGTSLPGTGRRRR